MSVGLESRTQILPNPSIPTKVPGVFGPDYSFADSIPLPSEVGVRDGDDVQSVIDAAKGAAFYIDTIGFGKSSSRLTAGMPLKPLGVNTFMRTGFVCSNGADMWMYNAGIPKGNALGKRLADGLEGAGFPPMKGLAPGILEDVQSALDPTPLMSAIFGTGNPMCVYKEERVGDQDNKIQNSATNAYYVENPETVYYKGGVPYQRRWVYAADLTSDAYKNTPKTFCPDGSAVADHKDTDCLKPIVSTAAFQDYSSNRRDAKELLRMIGAASLTLLSIVLVHRCIKK